MINYVNSHVLCGYSMIFPYIHLYMVVSYKSVPEMAIDIH